LIGIVQSIFNPSIVNKNMLDGIFFLLTIGPKGDTIFNNSNNNPHERIHIVFIGKWLKNFASFFTLGFSQRRNYMPEIKPDIETFAKIKVVGIGGSGGSAVNRMIRSKIKGIEFIAINTDVQALHHSLAPVKLHIGRGITRGLGAGMDPEIGRRSAEENQNEIRDLLKGADMVFITCGMGGGTGSGAAPVVADLAKEAGALTVAVVTKPFTFEGAQRRDIGERAYETLSGNVDTVISIPNDRILQIIDKKTSLIDAFSIVDDVLRQGVQGISEIITVPGLINVDFADVKAIMSNQGSALMGIGRATGENRAVEAAKAAIASPLLEVSVEGARGILFTVTGGPNMGMHEVSEAAKIITASADQNAKVIFGAIIDESMKDDIKVTVIATGFEDRREAKTAQNTVVAGGVYNPSPFVKNKNSSVSAAPTAAPAPVVEPPRQAAEKAAPPRVEAKPVSRPKEEDVDDLEIPAFIRKKMLN
jgi:cell division protein FtsZ